VVSLGVGANPDDDSGGLWREGNLTARTWAESGDFNEVKASYGGFIQDVVRHYPKANSWDVFNEIVEENQPLRDEPLIQRYGLPFIDFCLRETHQAAPRARLALNEYNLECDRDWCRSKQANMTRLLRDLKRMGSPLHAVGIQAHLSTVHRASLRSTLDMINAIADLGLHVAPFERARHAVEPDGHVVVPLGGDVDPVVRVVEGLDEASGGLTAVDHVVSLADGGRPYDRANLRGMCYEHHARRSSRQGAEARKRKRLEK
jgi:hypothetical protein